MVGVIVVVAVDVTTVVVVVIMVMVVVVMVVVVLHVFVVGVVVVGVVPACYYFCYPALVTFARGKLDGSNPGTRREDKEAANASDESTTAA